MFVNFKKAGNGSPVILAINTDKIISINLAANGTRGSVTLASRALDVLIESGTINTLKDLGFVQVGTKLINSALVEYITQTDKRISLIDGTELNEEQLALFVQQQVKAKEIPTASTRITDDTQIEYIWSNKATEAETATEAELQKPKRKKKE